MIQDYGKAIEGIRRYARDYLYSNNLKSVVIGMSGGIDSALCAALLEPVCRELGIHLIGRSYPILTNKPDEISRAYKCGKAFCTNFREIDLAPDFRALSDNILATESYIVDDAHAAAIAQGNRKARLRMIRLFELAGLNQGLVISTDNYTEFLLSFWTQHGDVGDLAPIQLMWKTEVYRASEYLIEQYNRNLTIPGNVDRASTLQAAVDAVPTDGLGITSCDLDQIMPGWRDRYSSFREAYEAVDQILIDHHQLDHPVMKRHVNSEFKRWVPIRVPRKDITDDPLSVE